MVNRPFHKLLFTLALLFCKAGFSQYILNGTATQNSCNCYTLTRPNLFESGSVWNANKISLNEPFDFWFNVFLGCGDSPGADGIVFILQPISTSIGSTGAGMGFAGISPSIGIALDTYQNIDISDPAIDHISIQANGNIIHTTDLAGPVAISSTSDNVEDCQWHKLRISWDPASKWLRAYFDGVLRVETQIDLVSAIFNSDPNVYWGFAGATGGEMNLQQFCTALDPDFSTNFVNDVACAPALMEFTNQSESFAPIASVQWNFGNGNTSNLFNPPAQTYAEPGTYQVTMKITGLDGCENDTTKTITIGSVPFAPMEIFDTCFLKTPRINSPTEGVGLDYLWRLDGIPVSNEVIPELSALSKGPHELRLIVSSSFGCGQPDSASRDFFIHPLPAVSISHSQLCDLVEFKSLQTDSETTISAWSWRFGDNGFSVLKDPVHNYNKGGQFTVELFTVATNGCHSDTITSTIDIPEAFAFAGNDTVIIKDLPFQLKGQGNGNFFWTPGLGLSDPFSAEPITSLSNNQTYLLTVTTPEGCMAKDSVHIKVYRGPTAYVPSGFTPNNDGLNDWLRPVYVGIKKLKSFVVFNRWGQLVFSTSDMSKGWDGKINGKVQGSGSFVWYVKAINYLDEEIILKGTTTLLQ